MSTPSRFVPASQPRRRADTHEVALGYDAYVVLPDPNGPAATLSRYTEWSRRVQRVLANAGVRVLATLFIVTFAWLCQRASA